MKTHNCAVKAFALIVWRRNKASELQIATHGAQAHMSKISHIAVAAASVAVLALVGASAASAATYTVQAINPVSSWLDTGMTLNPATTYDFAVVNPATLWSAGSEQPYSRDSTANGIDPVASGYGNWTMLGFTANYGALVGEVGSTFFNIGTGPIALSGLSGDLKVGYWDSYYGDNSGSQTLSITAVPEPATWAMMLVGLGGLGVAMRARRRLAAAA